MLYLRTATTGLITGSLYRNLLAGVQIFPEDKPLFIWAWLPNLPSSPKVQQSRAIPRKEKGTVTPRGRQSKYFSIWNNKLRTCFVLIINQWITQIYRRELIILYIKTLDDLRSTDNAETSNLRCFNLTPTRQVIDSCLSAYLMSYNATRGNSVIKGDSNLLTTK